MPKCMNCSRKTTIMVTCSCKQMYCIGCRMPEDHNCQFDFKKQGKEHIIKNNPIISSNKLIKL